MVGDAAVSARKITMVTHWGDAFVSIGNSKNMSTVSLVLPQACYEPTEFQTSLFGRKLTNFNSSFENSIFVAL